MGQGGDSSNAVFCAHRGDSERFVENTLPAFRSAIERKAPLVELDVRLTSDGVAVVNHDPNLWRIWRLRRSIEEVSIDELRGLGDADHRPPTLDEVCRLFHDQTSTLLLDFAEPRGVDDALHVVKDAGIKCCWCGCDEAMRRVRRLDEDATVWQAWEVSRAPRHSDVAELRPAYVNMRYSLASAAVVEGVHGLGCKVAVWTVNSPRVADDCIRVGVDSLTTDRLSLFVGDGKGKASV